MFKKILKFLNSKNTIINRIPEIEKLLLSSVKSHKVNLGQIQSELNSKKEKIINL